LVTEKGKDRGKKKFQRKRKSPVPEEKRGVIPLLKEKEDILKGVIVVWPLKIKRRWGRKSKRQGCKVKWTQDST